jgi:catechol 2,3-dioxygenase-like lactoylglutathione lyase family enzyme
MFSDQLCAAMLPASDYERAKKWYADTLGLTPRYDDPNGAEYETAGGTRFSVYPSQFAGTNQATAMGFLTGDLSAEMDQLRSKGVAFEEYDIPGVHTENGVHDFGNGEKGAWFKDSEGNIIALFESPRYK